MIKHAYAVTSPEFIEDTKALLTKILRNSSYPELFINENLYINLFIPISAIRPKFKSNSVRYVSCPYFNPLIKSIQSVIDQNDLKMKLAPKPLSNNRRMLFTKIKDVRDHSSIKNAIFKLSCMNCDFNHTSTTKNFDVQTSIQRLVSDNDSPYGLHIAAFPSHSINRKAKIIKTFYNKYDTEHSNYVLRHIEKMKKIY